jgi:hypothetical protein
MVGMTSNVEMTQSLQEHMYRLYTNMMPFQIRNLSTYRLWYQWRVLELIPHKHKGTTIMTRIRNMRLLFLIHYFRGGMQNIISFFFDINNGDFPVSKIT